MKQDSVEELFFICVAESFRGKNTTSFQCDADRCSYTNTLSSCIVQSVDRTSSHPSQSARAAEEGTNKDCKSVKVSDVWSSLVPPGTGQLVFSLLLFETAYSLFYPSPHSASYLFAGFKLENIVFVDLCCRILLNLPHSLLNLARKRHFHLRFIGFVLLRHLFILPPSEENVVFLCVWHAHFLSVSSP